jgi:hypothetical protein
MKYSQIKALKSFCEDQTSNPDWKDVLSNLLSNEEDFTVDNVRFIADESILSIMADEIFSDDYMLGCFNASFIANNSSLNIELVQACQDAEAYQAIGKALNDTLDEDQKESFCEAYASADSYGHHFNGYDFSESEYRFNGKLYHVFDNR